MVDKVEDVSGCSHSDDSLPCWTGVNGVYVIPEHLRDVPISESGWPDLRYKKAMELLEWASRQDQEKGT
jgi:hypothetical protein